MPRWWSGSNAHGLMTKIFFYGLFMDPSHLRDQGLHPEVLGRAKLPGFRIHIGERATLIRSDAHSTFGVVMSLSDDEAKALYSEPSVMEYRRESVSVSLLATGEHLQADCYNLPSELALAGSNPVYATKLSRLLSGWGFDAAYVTEVASFASPLSNPRQPE